MHTIAKVSRYQNLPAYSKELPYYRRYDCPHNCIQHQVGLGIEDKISTQEASVYSVRAWPKSKYASELANASQENS